MQDPEWSGVCRSEKNEGLYWAIADSPAPPRLHLINEHGFVQAHYPVLSPGGGLMKNHDWEDVAVADGNVWILDNIANGNTSHELICLPEPTPQEPFHNITEWHEFEMDMDQEALVAFPTKLWIIPKKVNHFSLASFFASYLPQQIVEVLRMNQPGTFKQRMASLIPVTKLKGMWGVCTGADFITFEKLHHTVVNDFQARGQPVGDGLLLVMTYTGSYITNPPHFYARLSLTEPVGGQNEGCCFTHDGRGVLYQNERGDYRRAEIGEFRWERP